MIEHASRYAPRHVGCMTCFGSHTSAEEAIACWRRKNPKIGRPTWDVSRFITVAAAGVPDLPYCRCQRGCCSYCSAELKREAGSAELPADWRSRRVDVLRRDWYRCQRCRRSGRLTVHHIKPRDRGGSHELSNLITLCDPCHDWAEVETAERPVSRAELMSLPDRAAPEENLDPGAVPAKTTPTVVVSRKVTHYRRDTRKRAARSRARKTRLASLGRKG